MTRKPTTPAASAARRSVRTSGGKVVQLKTGVGTSRRAVPADATPAQTAKAVVERAAKLTAAEDAKAAKAAAPRTRKAAPAKAAPAKAAPAKAAPAAPAERKSRIAKVEYTVPAGYELRWPHASFDSLRKVDSAVEGAAWIVVCTRHGVMADATSAVDCDAVGSAKGRAVWCPGCKKG